MNKEEILENISILDDKDIFEKLDKNKELRDWFLVELNVSLQRSESIVANIKDRKELKCYKNAVTSLEQENEQLKQQLDKFENPEDMTLMMMWCTEKVKDENYKLKQIIDKAIEYIEIHKRKDEFLELNEWGTRDLLEILKGE